jgi:3'(2'), 5'-bisphosphate nucleotidase
MDSKLLTLAIEAAVEGGKEILGVYQTNFKVDFKEDKSPLTVADEKANAKINEYLIGSNIPIISEENKQTDFEIRKNWNVCWIVDPLDGTKEFVKRNGEFTVNIALVKNGRPILGVIFVPVEEILYFADVEKNQAFKVKFDINTFDISKIMGVAEKIYPRPTILKDKIVVGSRSHMSPETEDFVRKLKTEVEKIEIVSKGSSLKFCLVAEGQADFYPRFAPTMEWDTAAGQAICEAVGLQVISQETNQPLLYNKENLLNPWFLVSNNER